MMTVCTSVCLSVCVLAVPVQYLSPVAEVEASEELEEQQMHVVRVQGARVLLHVAAQVRLLGGGKLAKQRLHSGVVQLAWSASVGHTPEMSSLQLL